jgi:hypothetical protein
MSRHQRLTLLVVCYAEQLGLDVDRFSDRTLSAPDA